MKRANRIGILLALATALLLGGGLEWAGSQEMEASPGERLEVDLRTGAKLTITGWDRDVVAVDADFTGRDAGLVEFEVRRKSGGVSVSSEIGSRARGASVGGRVTIHVPRRFDLELDSAGGRIEIADVQGEIRGKTMGGELKLRGLAGTVDLTTLGGNIELTDSDVDGKVETYGGNVHLSNVDGNVEAETMGGEVVYDDVRSGGSRGEVKISTLGGNIRAPDAMNGADLDTLGGNISIGRVAKYLRAETMGGNIEAEAVDGWVRATTMGGSIRVTMVGDPRDGKRDVRLISMSGDIRLTVPDGLSMEVDITLDYTKNSKQRYGITSDFPIEINESPNWRYDQGSPRKSIYGRGTIGGGEHRIKIETINGNVELLRGS